MSDVLLTTQNYAMAELPPPPHSSLPKSYLLIENPSKSNNLGPILRCAAAFAIHQVIFIGPTNKCSVKGSHGSSKHVHITSFLTFERAIQYLRNECQIAFIVGILGDTNVASSSLLSQSTEDLCEEEEGNKNGETARTLEFLDKKVPGVLNAILDTELNIIRPSSERNDCNRSNTNNTNSADTTANATTTKKQSYPIHTRPFPKHENICFSMNKRSLGGLPMEQAELCDYFVHVQTAPPLPLPSMSSTPPIPIHGLLDSQTCLSIVLHHFNAFTGYEERTFEGQKFDVSVNAQKGRMAFDENGDSVRRERLEQRMQLEKEQLEQEGEIEEDKLLW